MYERYRHQIRFRELGTAGQEKLLSSRVLIVGAGALGGMNAMMLARAGVGFLRIVDGDIVELSNLHRQYLFTEADAEQAVLKTAAAAARLKEAAADLSVDPIAEYLNTENADRIMEGMDLVIDSTDNMKTRLLINDLCAEKGIPWIYGGVAGAEGMTGTFLPGGPCLRCFLGKDGASKGSAGRGTAEEGILGMLPAAVAACQSAEALKILTGAGMVRKGILFIDLWNHESLTLPVRHDPACPVCGKY